MISAFVALLGQLRMIREERKFLEAVREELIAEERERARYPRTIDLEPEEYREDH